MVQIRFVVQDINLKNTMVTNTLVFNSFDESVLEIINNQRTLLEKLNGVRILCLIEKVD